MTIRETTVYYPHQYYNNVYYVQLYRTVYGAYEYILIVLIHWTLGRFVVGG